MTKKDNSGLPREKETWAIRGIEAETRTAATMAARRAGMTVGQWCNRALREAATSAVKEKPLGPTLEDTLTKLAESIERQNARFEAVEASVMGLAGGEATSLPKNSLMRLYGLLWGKKGHP